MTNEEIKKALHNGVVEIVFLKKDGTKRYMNATVDIQRIPSSSLSRSRGERNDEVQKVFDLDIKEWRSFRWDSLISAKVVK